MNSQQLVRNKALYTYGIILIITNSGRCGLINWINCGAEITMNDDEQYKNERNRAENHFVFKHITNVSSKC